MKPILFVDFDGTLCHDRFWRSLNPSEYEQIQELLFKRNQEMASDWMKGGYSSEEINQFLAGRLGIDYDRLWKTFVHDCKTMNIPTVVLDLIKQTKAHYRTILMTDNMDCLDRFTVPALGLDSYFDRIVNSFGQKCLKRDEAGKAFLEEIANARAHVADCILIDDSESMCALFRSMGGKALRATEKEPLQYWLKSVSISV